MSKFVLGLDLGQTRDYTAVAALDRERHEYEVPYLCRFPLGTPYTEIVRSVVRLARRLGDEFDALVVDATGVGPPVVDLLRPHIDRRKLYGVTITGGFDVNREDRHA